jgi:hypothetical protein
MINDNLRELLVRRVGFANSDIPKLVDLVRHPKRATQVGSVLTQLSGEHVNLGMFGYFAEGNIQTLKQHFHVASKLREMSSREIDGETLASPISFLYALLSDSSEVIRSFATLSPLEFSEYCDNPKTGQFYVHLIQLALRDEYDSLREYIQMAKTRASSKQIRDYYSSGEDYYSLLMSRNIDGLQRIIQAGATKQKGDPKSEDFLADVSVIQAKLCWIKGIEVQVDSPLVPMDLMPVAPLPHYDDKYDFLKPDWVTPPRGLLGKVSRWIFPQE